MPPPRVSPSVSQALKDHGSMLSHAVNDSDIGFALGTSESVAQHRAAENALQFLNHINIEHICNLPSHEMTISIG